MAKQSFTCTPKMRSISPAMKQATAYRAIALGEMREASGHCELKPSRVPIYDGLTKPITTGRGAAKVTEPGHPKVVGSYQPPSLRDDSFPGSVEPSPRVKPSKHGFQQLNLHNATSVRVVKARDIGKPAPQAFTKEALAVKVAATPVAVERDTGKAYRDFQRFKIGARKANLEDKRLEGYLQAAMEME